MGVENQRAGSTATWIGPEGAVPSGSLDRVGVIATKATRPVGQLLPNPIGLYDLHGNVREWCQDGYAPYPVQPTSDPQGSGSLRVIRGGSRSDGPTQARLANRQGVDQGMRSPFLGLRFAIEAEVAPAAASRAVAPPDAISPRIYLVQAGDTLTRIAERELGSRERWKEIARLNPGLEVRQPLTVGRELVLSRAAAEASP